MDNVRSRPLIHVQLNNKRDSQTAAQKRPHEVKSDFEPEAKRRKISDEVSFYDCDDAGPECPTDLSAPDWFEQNTSYPHSFYDQDGLIRTTFPYQLPFDEVVDKSDSCPNSPSTSDFDNVDISSQESDKNKSVNNDEVMTLEDECNDIMRNLFLDEIPSGDSEDRSDTENEFEFPFESGRQLSGEITSSSESFSLMDAIIEKPPEAEFTVRQFPQHHNTDLELLAGIGDIINVIFSHLSPLDICQFMVVDSKRMNDVLNLMLTREGRAWRDAAKLTNIQAWCSPELLNWIHPRFAALKPGLLKKETGICGPLVRNIHEGKVTLDQIQEKRKLLETEIKEKFSGHYLFEFLNDNKLIHEYIICDLFSLDDVANAIGRLSESERAKFQRALGEPLIRDAVYDTKYLDKQIFTMGNDENLASVVVKLCRTKEGRLIKQALSDRWMKNRVRSNQDLSIEQIFSAPIVSFKFGKVHILLIKEIQDGIDKGAILVERCLNPALNNVHFTRNYLEQLKKTQN